MATKHYIMIDKQDSYFHWHILNGGQLKFYGTNSKKKLTLKIQQDVKKIYDKIFKMSLKELKKNIKKIFKALKKIEVLAGKKL